MNCCTENFIQQKIAFRDFRWIAVEHQVTVKTGFPGGSGSQAAMIGLYPAGRDQSIFFLLYCLTNEKFKFSCLISSKTKGSKIISFHINGWATVIFSQGFQVLDWCRKFSEMKSGQVIKFHMNTPGGFLRFLHVFNRSEGFFRPFSES